MKFQLNGSKNVKKPLTNLKSCALAHQFLPTQILGNHSCYIQMQVFSALELSYTKNRMELNRLFSYASQSLSRSESKYLINRLEFLCLKWATTDQFHQYLYGNTFYVYTDNNTLTYVLSTAKLDVMRHWLVAGLANYNFHIHYKSAKSNVEADNLSRIDWEK